LVSFLLINFWFTRVQASKSAFKAILLNKFGDCAFLVFIILVYKEFGTFEYSYLLANVSGIIEQPIPFFGYLVDNVTLMALFLVFAAFAKSAQFGLHIWLPDAMEGPTPVSALLHAATMVTAGVFLIIRFSFFIESSPMVLDLLMSVGVITMFFAGIVGSYQADFKRIIAFSTCSQLGLMFFACGFSQYNLALFHLVNHAFFKALLFLVAGILIHSVFNTQDLDNYGSLSFRCVFWSAYLTVGSSAIMALPNASGFFSKELLLSLSFSEYSALLVETFYLLLIVGTFLSSFYSVRSFLASLDNLPSLSFTSINFFAGTSFFMLFPVFILTFAAVAFSFWGLEFFTSLGLTCGLLSNISTDMGDEALDFNEFVSISDDWFPLLVTFSAFLVALLVHFLPWIFFSSSLFIYFKKFNVAVKKWGIDTFYVFFVSFSFLRVSFFGFFKNWDRGALLLFFKKGWSFVLKFYQYIRGIPIPGRLIDALHAWLIFWGVLYFWAFEEYAALSFVMQVLVCGSWIVICGSYFELYDQYVAEEQKRLQREHIKKMDPSSGYFFYRWYFLKRNALQDRILLSLQGMKDNFAKKAKSILKF